MLKFFFSKLGQTSRSRSKGKNLWYNVKDLVIENTHVEYESPTQCSKLWRNWSHMRLKKFNLRPEFEETRKIATKRKIGRYVRFFLFRSVQLCLVLLLFRKFSYFYHFCLQSRVIGKSPIPEPISWSRCQNGFEANAGWFQLLERYKKTKIGTSNFAKCRGI